MKVIVIDDDYKGREVLKKLLTSLNKNITIVGEANSVESGYDLLQSCECDALFLDIHMRDGTGFDLISQLNNADFQLIFTTAHNEYAINAFKVNAIDYLLKPIDLKELKATVEKITITLEKSRPLNYFSHIQKILEKELKATNKKKQIAISSQNSVEIIDVDNIIHCKSDSNYTHINLADESTILSTKTLKEFEKQLEPFNFYRIHNSHLVNLSHIKKVDKNGFVVLTNGSNLEISRRKKNGLLEKLNYL